MIRSDLYQIKLGCISLCYSYNLTTDSKRNETRHVDSRSLKPSVGRREMGVLRSCMNW